MTTDLTEKQWAAQISDLAKTLGWLRYHTYRSDRSPAGFPDEVLVKDRVVFMELKRDLTGKRSVDRARQPSPLQVEWMDRLAKAGAEVYLARPADWQEVGRVLGRPWHLCVDVNRGYLATTGRVQLMRPACMWIPGVGRYDESLREAA